MKKKLKSDSPSRAAACSPSYYTFRNREGQTFQLRGDLSMEDLVRMGCGDIRLVKPETPLKPHHWRCDHYILPLKADCPSASCSASWLPIKTAPNSLNVILVTDGESVWTDQKIGEHGDDVLGGYYFNGHENWEEVTHWMPIPSLPNVKSGGTAREPHADEGREA